MTHLLKRFSAIYWPILFCLFFLLTGGGLAAQPLVVQVAFSGLKRTQPQALLRLLELQEGMPFDYTTLQSDLRRLGNYNGMVKADYQLDTLANGLRIHYLLQEGVTRYPIALLGGLKDNFWWEIGYQDENWQGRGNTLSASLRQTDGRLGGSLRFGQRFWRNKNWGYALQLERYASQEPLYFGAEQVDYRYSNHNLGLVWHYHFTPESRLEVGLTYFVEDYEKVNLEQVPGPAQRTEYKQLLRLAYTQAWSKYDLYQPEGGDFRASGEFVFQKNTIPFYLFRAILRQYRPLGRKGLLATRLSAGYSANKNSPFAPFVVDSRVNIRGAGNRVDRGTAMMVLNLEYRHLLLQRRWLAVQAVVFNDVGTWRNPGGTISDVLQRENLKCFAGLGLRFISDWARQAVLRIDYGYGLHPVGQRGIVLGLGQYF